MIDKENELTIVKTAKQITRITLIGGTALFLAVTLTQAKFLMFVSLIFTLIAGLANGLVFFILLLYLIGPPFRKKILSTAILMLINIPVAMLYTWIIVERSHPNF